MSDPQHKTTGWPRLKAALRLLLAEKCLHWALCLMPDGHPRQLALANAVHVYLREALANE